MAPRTCQPAKQVTKPSTPASDHDDTNQLKRMRQPDSPPFVAAQGCKIHYNSFR